MCSAPASRTCRTPANLRRRDAGARRDLSRRAADVWGRDRLRLGFAPRICNAIEHCQRVTRQFRRLRDSSGAGAVRRRQPRENRKSWFCLVSLSFPCFSMNLGLKFRCIFLNSFLRIRTFSVGYGRCAAKAQLPSGSIVFMPGNPASASARRWPGPVNRPEAALELRYFDTCRRGSVPFGVLRAGDDPSARAFF